MSLFRLENVVHTYRQRGTARNFEALRVQELSIERGEVLTVLGPNGSGKSTLLELAAFLQRPGSGRVLLDGIDPWQTGGELAARRRCPILLQQTTLFATSVLKNVMLPLQIHGLNRAEARKRASEAIELVRLSDLLRRRHNEMSVGQKRRVALARVLALRSPVVLLDEPTASLDLESERLIETIIRDINRERGTTVIMASHNHSQAVELSTRIVTLVAGRLIPGAPEVALPDSMRRADVPLPENTTGAEDNDIE